MLYILPAGVRNASVRANMRMEEYGKQAGLLERKSLKYQISTNELRHWDFQASNMTVAMLGSVHL